MKTLQTQIIITHQARQLKSFAGRSIILLTGLFIVTCLGAFVEQSPNLFASEPSSTLGWLRFPESPVFAIDSLDIPARQTGVLESLDVKVNDEVEAGKRIGYLDRSSAQLEESIAAVQAQFAIMIAKDESDIQFAKIVVEEARIALESYEQINSRGSATDSEMRSKKLAVLQAELKVQHATQALEQAKLKARQAQVGLLTARQNLERMDLVAPFAGTIAELFKQKGEWVQTGQPVVRIVRMDELRVDCFVPRTTIQIASLINMPAQARIAGPNNEIDILEGRVHQFEPEVTATGEIRIGIIVQNQRRNGHWLLLPGMAVDLTIQKPLSNESASLLRSPQSNNPPQNASKQHPMFQKR